jgi:hypothetical protein
VADRAKLDTGAAGQVLEEDLVLEAFDPLVGDSGHRDLLDGSRCRSAGFRETRQEPDSTSRNRLVKRY